VIEHLPDKHEILRLNLSTNTKKKSVRIQAIEKRISCKQWNNYLVFAVTLDKRIAILEYVLKSSISAMDVQSVIFAKGINVIKLTSHEDIKKYKPTTSLF
jgi:hypothetical protein